MHAMILSIDAKPCHNSARTLMAMQVISKALMKDLQADATSRHAQCDFTL